MKKYSISALVYAIVGALCGVYYREFTKFMDIPGATARITALGLVHTHLLVLGMIFFMLALCLAKSFGLGNSKLGKIHFPLHHIGLGIASIGMLVRGTLEVLEINGMYEMTKGADGALAGVSGLGHIILGVAIVLFVVDLFLVVKRSDNT